MEKPKRSPDFNARLLPDGYVLIYSEKSEWVHTLTPIGGLVWEFCDGENSAEQIAELISAQTKMSTKAEDVKKLLDELENNRLLVADN